MPRPVPAPAQAYLPVLDGLRAVAILLVVAAHAGLDRAVPGAFGVTLFFFISGYLITRQLLGSLAARGRVGLPGFFLRRVLRLAPAGLAYVALAGGAYVAAGGHISALGWLAAAFYGANVFDLWVGYRSTLAGVRHPFNILWSLAIEEHFYALWPLVLTALWRWRFAALAMLVLCVAVLCWRVWLFGHCTWHFGAVCGRAQPNPAWRYNRLYQGTDTLPAAGRLRPPGAAHHAARGGAGDGLPRIAAGPRSGAAPALHASSPAGRPAQLLALSVALGRVRAGGPSGRCAPPRVARYRPAALGLAGRRIVSSGGTAHAAPATEGRQPRAAPARGRTHTGAPACSHLNTPSPICWTAPSTAWPMSHGAIPRRHAWSASTG
jgi:hypothetical protein